MNSSLELLESRIAPASLINHRTVIFSDVDGDDVTETFSKPFLTAASLASGFTFVDSPARADGSIPQALSRISFFDMPNWGAATRTDISVMAVRSVSHGGDGKVDVGSIDAFVHGLGFGIDLGAVRVSGDLGSIDAGDESFATLGVRMLRVESWGINSLGEESDIVGRIDAVRVSGDFLGSFYQRGGDGTNIGTLVIGGSLGTAHGKHYTGWITTQGWIGLLQIGGSIVAGDGRYTSLVQADKDIRTVRVGGSLIGGGAENSGSIVSYGNMGRSGGVTILGSVLGGAGEASGAISASGVLGETVIGGSVRGGAGQSSGSIKMEASYRGIRIGGDLIGGSNYYSGSIGIYHAGSNVRSLTIGGSIVGGSSPESGVIHGNYLGTVNIGGDLTGGNAPNSGMIFGIRIAHVFIGGNVSGVQDIATPANTLGSGTILARYGSIGSVFIGGDFRQGNIIAAIYPGDDFLWGAGSGSDRDTDAQPRIVNRIGSIVIQGKATSGIGHYGIEAREIGRLVVGGVSYLHGSAFTPFDTGFFLDAAHTILVRKI